jgi:hypothetical protein
MRPSPPPGADYPPPGASYPPPGASHPPPGASYPPPGASHPAPGAGRLPLTQSVPAPPLVGVPRWFWLGLAGIALFVLLSIWWLSSG